MSFFKWLKAWLTYIPELIELRENWSDEIDAINNHYSCDHCGGNCGQCGWSSASKKQAKERVREKYIMLRKELIKKHFGIS